MAQSFINETPGQYWSHRHAIQFVYVLHKYKKALTIMFPKEFENGEQQDWPV